MARIRRFLDRYRRKKRNSRIFRPRFCISAVSAVECFQRFRFKPESIRFLITLLNQKIQRSTARTRSISSELQVLLSLRYFATGGVFRLIGDSVGISESVVSRTVHRVAKALAEMAPTYIKMPQDTTKAKSDFFSIAGFPHVIGCIDGTFIRIRGPSEHEQDFVNRKGFHSLNVQMTCDANFRITSVVAKWPGSVHDARVYRNSGLSVQMENGVYDGILLGDSAYPCLPYLMTPFITTPTQSHVKFNTALCRTRVRIEQTFGILKKRFMCLGEILRVNLTRAATIITACAVLHNIGIDRGDILEHYDLSDDADENFNNGSTSVANTGNLVREQIRQSFFP